MSLRLCTCSRTQVQCKRTHAHATQTTPQVPFNGVSYNLRVLELQPDPAVSVIDTDIGCDVGPSM